MAFIAPSTTTNATKTATEPSPAVLRARQAYERGSTKWTERELNENWESEATDRELQHLIETIAEITEDIQRTTNLELKNRLCDMLQQYNVRLAELIPELQPRRLQARSLQHELKVARTSIQPPPEDTASEQGQLGSDDNPAGANPNAQSTPIRAPALRHDTSTESSVLSSLHFASSPPSRAITPYVSPRFLRPEVQLTSPKEASASTLAPPLPPEPEDVDAPSQPELIPQKPKTPEPAPEPSQPPSKKNHAKKKASTPVTCPVCLRTVSHLAVFRCFACKEFWHRLTNLHRQNRLHTRCSSPHNFKNHKCKNCRRARYEQCFKTAYPHRILDIPSILPPITD